MIKKHLKLLIVTSIVTLLPIVAGVILWNRLPARMPFHWNLSGEVDGYASKAVAVFVMPCVMLAFHWLCAFVTAADPKNKNHSQRVMQLVLWLIPAISVFMHALVYCMALGKGVRVESFLPILLGLVFAIVGNYLPKCEQSHTVGIKLPWTLHSEENWNRTHRLAGRIWMASGLLMIAVGFFGLLWPAILLSGIMVFIPCIYSYALYRKGV